MNLDTKTKNYYINQNLLYAEFGNFKTFPVARSIKFKYDKMYDPGVIDNLCRVIVHNKCALDIANTLSDHGIESLQTSNSIPCIVYMMGNEFNGTNFESGDGIYDENIILKTNYAHSIKKQHDYFPINEKDHYVVYSSPITLIRDDNYNQISNENVFKISVITVCFSRKNNLIENDNKKSLCSYDLLKFQIYIETVFQAAIRGLHEVLILSMLGPEYMIPIDDQILIFNICIMKYGHKLKGIMIAVPLQVSFQYTDQHIIKPRMNERIINNISTIINTNNTEHLKIIKKKSIQQNINYSTDI